VVTALLDQDVIAVLEEWGGAWWRSGGTILGSLKTCAWTHDRLGLQIHVW